MHPPEDPRRLTQRHLFDGARLRERLAAEHVESILAASRAIVDCYRAGGKLLLCGNGGSAADCQHMAAELVSRLHRDFDRPGLPAIALTTDTSFLTAYANDCGYDGVFERQVRTLGRRGDVLLGISTSGESENVVRAFTAAREAGITTLALLGEGGRLASLATVAVGVPSSDTQHIQEAHLAVEHILCELVEQTLYGAAPSAAEPL